MNSGLYALAGASATALAAAWAKRLEDPITKVSKVYRGFSREVSERLSLSALSPESAGSGRGRISSRFSRAAKLSPFSDAGTG